MRISFPTIRNVQHIVLADFEWIQNKIDYMPELRLYKRYDDKTTYNTHVDVTSIEGLFMRRYTSPVTQFFKKSDVKSIKQKTGNVRLKRGAIPIEFSQGDFLRKLGIKSDKETYQDLAPPAAHRAVHCEATLMLVGST